MRRIELRDLDGPNLFLLAPAIKLELAVGPDDLRPDALAALAARLEPLGLADDAPPAGAAALGGLLADALVALCERAGAPEPDVHWAALETPGHHALAWTWDHRRFGLGIGEALAAVATGEAVDLRAEADRLRVLLAERDEDDAPLLVRDADRRRPIVAVTGTNGKTTTTRLIAHILAGAGLRPGWATTAGVYIDGDKVLDGDYSGPSGARTVLEAPDVDVAVLETARGGILLRGLAYESNDVAVFTNVSADHLGLQGIQTVEGLAKVKSLVVRVTRADGWAVLNADDPLVRGAAAGIRAGRFWISQEPDNPHVTADLADGGRALLVRDGTIVEARGDQEQPLLAVEEIPIAFGGVARHMIENALCAAAACLALGRAPAEVAAGLRSFGTDPAHNPGRNEVFRLGGGTVVVDYAHNEIGLTQLLTLARTLTGPAGRLTAVIGSAGDRDDGMIRGLGRIAGTLADAVVLKGTERYLRGRADAAEILALLAAGVAEGGGEPPASAPTELVAIDLALDAMGPGDVVAVMSFEDTAATLARVEARGGEAVGGGSSLTPRRDPLRGFDSGDPAAAAGEGAGG